MLNKNQIFKNVLERCNIRIDIAAKYLIDNKFSADDYTFEYAVTELLYDNCIIKRALTNEKNLEIEKIFSDTKNLVEHFGDKLWPRLFDLHKNYFSVEELGRLHLQIEDSYDENDSQDDHLISLIIDLFERKDKVNVFSEDGSIFTDYLKSFYGKEYGKVINSYKDLSKSINKELRLLISKSDVISNYATGIQSSIRQMNLIPNTQEYKWWYTINYINSENIEEALKQSLEKEIKTNLIEGALNEKYATEPAWNKIKNKFSDIIGKCRKHNDGFNNLIDDILVPKDLGTPALAYKSWGSEKERVMINQEILGYFLAQKEVIEDLIKHIDRIDEKEINDQERKELIATAYIMIGKPGSAMSVLDD